MFEHKTISLSDQVFERLEDEILWGNYQRGDTLTEMKLVTDLGVSRTPIRDALHRLEQERLIEITPRGILVLGVTGKDLADIYAIRIRIEGLAAREAAKYITDDQLAELKETLELQEFYVGKQNPDGIKIMDSQFHSLICQFSGSAILYDTIIPLHKKIQRYRRAAVSVNERAQESVQEHRAIYEALVKRDSDEAEHYMVEHVRKARDYTLQQEDWL
ncbi:MAG: GntR family transcriptional regulator [Clostridia bacterium]|nr:GntR family transcriptional regulator [Clostridia bacterium]